MLKLVLMIALLASPAWALDGVGSVAGTRGEVAVLRAAETLAAAPGMTLQQGDRLVTGADGRALLQLEGGLTVTVGSNADLRLAELRGGGEKAAPTAWLDLLQGLVRALLTAPGATGDVQVRTPVAVTSVRSTEWTVEHAAEHTAVFCRDGAVEVTAAGATVILDPGDGTDVRGAAAPTEPVEWGAPRVADTLRRASLVGP